MGGIQGKESNIKSLQPHSFCDVAAAAAVTVPGIPDIGINRREFISNESMLLRRVALNLLMSFNEPFRAGNP